MKVLCIDDFSPRSDGLLGKPTGITRGKTYQVAEILEDQFSIMDDKMKLSRYSKYRFVVTDNSTVLPLRENFNRLTTDIRTQNKQLLNQVRILTDRIDQLLKKD